MKGRIILTNILPLIHIKRIDVVSIIVYISYGIELKIKGITQLLQFC